MDSVEDPNHKCEYDKHQTYQCILIKLGTSVAYDESMNAMDF